MDAAMVTASRNKMQSVVITLLLPSALCLRDLGPGIGSLEG
jgi:hypothetical protein